MFTALVSMRMVVNLAIMSQVTKLKCGEFVVVGLCVNHSVVDGIVAMDGFVHLWDETARSLPFYHFLIGTFSKLKTLP